MLSPKKLNTMKHPLKSLLVGSDQDFANDAAVEEAVEDVSDSI
jgi:hypothetical protein